MDYRWVRGDRAIEHFTAAGWVAMPEKAKEIQDSERNKFAYDGFTLMGKVFEEEDDGGRIRMNEETASLRSRMHAAIDEICDYKPESDMPSDWLSVSMHKFFKHLHELLRRAQYNIEHHQSVED